ncbi:MAG: hypothetical protein WA945_07785 [Arcobacteraceae bacterium]
MFLASTVTVALSSMLFNVTFSMSVVCGAILLLISEVAPTNSCTNSA